MPGGRKREDSQSQATQLGLFGADVEPSVAAARISPEVTELAGRLPRSVRMGTSSWSFPGWAGLVYAGRVGVERLSREGLSAYARHPLLRAVGLDRTFYAPLDAAGFARHAAQVPAGFRFLVKASQLCTFPELREGGGRGLAAANPRYLDAGFARDEVVAPAVEGLGSRLGVLLFQFPP